MTTARRTASEASTAVEVLSLLPVQRRETWPSAGGAGNVRSPADSSSVGMTPLGRRPSAWSATNSAGSNRTWYQGERENMSPKAEEAGSPLNVAVAFATV